MTIILYALLAWFLYQFIFKLVIPVYKASRKIRRGFRDMQEKMNEQYSQQQKQAPQEPTRPAKAPAGDYLDFEEVK